MMTTCPPTRLCARPRCLAASGSRRRPAATSRRPLVSFPSISSPSTPGRRLSSAYPAKASSSAPGDNDETPDEDQEVFEQIRGNSLNPNTPLGRAVANACAELEDLAKLEREIQDEAFALLKKLGVKRGDDGAGDDDGSGTIQEK